MASYLPIQSCTQPCRRTSLTRSARATRLRHHLAKRESRSSGPDVEVRSKRFREPRRKGGSLLRGPTRGKTRAVRKPQRRSSQSERPRTSHTKRAAPNRGHRVRDEYEGTTRAESDPCSGDRTTRNPHRPYAGLDLGRED